MSQNDQPRFKNLVQIILLQKSFAARFLMCVWSFWDIMY